MEGIPCVMCTTRKNLGWPMTQASINRFGKSLCLDHQIDEIKRTYPPKLAEQAIARLQKYRAGLGDNEQAA